MLQVGAYTKPRLEGAVQPQKQNSKKVFFLIWFSQKTHFLHFSRICFFSANFIQGRNQRNFKAWRQKGPFWRRPVARTDGSGDGAAPERPVLAPAFPRTVRSAARPPPEPPVLARPLPEPPVLEWPVARTVRSGARSPTRAAPGPQKTFKSQVYIYIYRLRDLDIFSCIPMSYDIWMARKFGRFSLQFS